MDLVDQIETLNALHESGTLSAEEFALAKKKLLEPSDRPNSHSFTNVYPWPRNDSDQFLGRAANLYINMRIIMTIIGVVIFVIFLFGFFIPMFNRTNIGFPR